MMHERPTQIPGLITAPMSWMYALGAAHKARMFDRGRGIVTLDRAVISVGNLSAGGTGKTPMVHFVLRTLIEAGHIPVVAMRGYKAAPGTLGDEASEHLQVFPDLALVAQPDRMNGLQKLFATPAGSCVDCVVLDDGFQHRQIARDLDLVLIDASRPPSEDALLPHGFLREPISALKRADEIVLTHTEMVGDEAAQRVSDWVRAQIGRAPIAWARHDWDGLDVHEHDATREESSAWLAGKRVLVVCGVGNPRGVLMGVEQRGGSIAGSMQLEDHRMYTSEDADRVLALTQEQAVDAVLTTRKDWVKISAWKERFDCPVIVPNLRLGFGDQQEMLAERIREAFRAKSRNA